MEILKLGRPYSFGGRQAIVPIKYTISMNKRSEIVGYYPYWYREYLKFVTIDTRKGPPFKTIAEKEGLTKDMMPEPVTIRINRNCTIREL